MPTALATISNVTPPPLSNSKLKYSHGRLPLCEHPVEVALLAGRRMVWRTAA